MKAYYVSMFIKVPDEARPKRGKLSKRFEMRPRSTCGRSSV
jgi:hypothetical protein